MGVDAMRASSHPAFITLMSRSVALHGDAAGARAVELCGAVIDQPATLDVTEDETPEDSRSVAFPRLLADVIRLRLSAFAGAGALAQALDLCTQMLRVRFSRGEYF